MIADASILPLILFWPVLVAALVIYLLRSNDRGVGLVIYYLLLFTIQHWLAAAVQLIPGYIPARDPTLTQLGTTYSFVGLISFVAGALILAPFLWHFHVTRMAQQGSSSRDERQPPHSAPMFLLVFGAFSYFILAPTVGSLPSLEAFTSNAAKLLFVGAMLLYYQIAIGKRSLPRWLVLAPVIAWPLVTVINEGFLGFGILGTLLVLIFVIQLRGKGLKLQHVLLSLLLAYATLSIISTYFTARNNIRQSVWGGEDIGTRFDTIYNSFFENFALLGFGAPDQLSFIEGRADLSNQAGAAIQRLNAGEIGYANGKTVGDAVLAVIPRVLWPDKPISIGGNAIASQYTGLQFANGTSVGAGQVMEFYINYGLVGIIGGFFLVGSILGVLDQAAARSLRREDSFGFALYVLPAFGLLLIGDDLVTITSTAVSGVVTALIVNAGFRMLFSRKIRGIPVPALASISLSEQSPDQAAQRQVH